MAQSTAATSRLQSPNGLRCPHVEWRNSMVIVFCPQTTEIESWGLYSLCTKGREIAFSLGLPALFQVAESRPLGVLPHPDYEWGQFDFPSPSGGGPPKLSSPSGGGRVGAFVRGSRWSGHVGSFLFSAQPQAPAPRSSKPNTDRVAVRLGATQFKAARSPSEILRFRLP